MSEQAVGAWVKGESRPSADNLLQLADYFKTSLDKLVGRLPPGAEALEPLCSQVNAVSEALTNLLPNRAIVDDVQKKLKEEEAAPKANEEQGESSDQDTSEDDGPAENEQNA